jgi:hypothetical protein
MNPQPTGQNPTCDTAPRELSLDDCLAVVGGQSTASASGAEVMPGPIVVPNPLSGFVGL